MSRRNEFIEEFDAEAQERWTLGRGWSISERGVLVGEGHSWARLEMAQGWSMYTFVANVQVEQGGLHLCYCVSDEGRYFVGIREHVVYLKKEAPWGDFFDLGEAVRRVVRPNGWNQVTVTGDAGGELHVYLDGERVIRAVDPQPLLHGLIAFETLDESKAMIDRVTVTFGGLHKPKQTMDNKLDNLCKEWPVKSAVVPQLFHLLERWFEKVKPITDLEIHVFQRLDKMDSIQTKALREGLEAYKSLLPHHRECLFRADMLGLPIEQPVGVDDIAVPWMEEGMAMARQMAWHESVCEPGKVRPWPLGIPQGPDQPYKTVTAPWPFISSINGMRVPQQRPPVFKFRPDEYDQTCTFDPSTGKLTSCIQAILPNCSDKTLGISHPAHNDKCLRGPTARAGDSAVLTGFNFCSSTVELWLTKVGSTTVAAKLKGVVCGDTKTPTVDAMGKYIADSRVSDRVNIQIPETLVPGNYYAKVRVKNDGQIVASDSTTPEYWVSHPAIMRVEPSALLKYHLCVDQSNCYVETDGEWSSDEIQITAYVSSFSMATGNGTVTLMKPMPYVMSDADEGDQWTLYPPWDLWGSSAAPALVDGAVVVAIVGYEVDSEDAWKKQIDSFGKAFESFMKDVWEFVGGKIDKIGEELSKLGWPWGLIAGAVAVVFTLGIGLIYAAWAPADLMLRELLILSEKDLYFLTDKNTPLPSASSTTIGDVRVDVHPQTKQGTKYREWRIYKSLSENSQYGLWYSIVRH